MFHKSSKPKSKRSHEKPSHPLKTSGVIAIKFQIHSNPADPLKIFSTETNRPDLTLIPHKGTPDNGHFYTNFTFEKSPIIHFHLPASRCSFPLGLIFGGLRELPLEAQGNGVPGKVTLALAAPNELPDEEYVSALEMDLSGKNLDAKDLNGKSDPFVVFFSVVDGKKRKLLKTKVKKSTLNPKWGKVTVPLVDTYGELLCVCYDWDMVGGNDYIGEFKVPISSLLNQGGIESQLLNTHKSNKPSGTLSMQNIQKIMSKRNCDSFNDDSFVSLLIKGLQFKMTIGVDFTISNASIYHPCSLHCINNPKTQYEYVISNVLGILGPHTDNLFPFYGFGCKINGVFREDFAVNFNENNPNCYGVEEVVEAYRHALPYLQFYGPSHIAPLINKAIEKVQNDKEKYHVLLIITDSDMSDPEETKKAITKAQNFPLSVLIVGVGDYDFKKMKLLDKGKGVGNRDIVQFVPYKKYLEKGDPYRLAKKLLSELPKQVVSYKNLVFKKSQLILKPPTSIIKPPFPQLPVIDFSKIYSHPVLPYYYGGFSYLNEQDLIALSLETDDYGNPGGPTFDLGQDGMFSEYRIVLAYFYCGEGCFDTGKKTLGKALKRKGFKIEFWADYQIEEKMKKPFTADELWILASTVGNKKVGEWIDSVWKQGKGICLMGDNDPFYAEVNDFLHPAFNFKLEGNDYGDKVLQVGKPDRKQEFGYHPITCGVSKLYEGITISYPKGNWKEHFELLATSSFDHPCLLYRDNIKHPSRGRIVIDTGFTKTYCNWDTAGTARYFVNVAVWLLSLETRFDPNTKYTIPQKVIYDSDDDEELNGKITTEKDNEDPNDNAPEEEEGSE